MIEFANKYWLYYSTPTVETNRQLSQWTIGIATSTDLLHWVKYAGNPVLPVDPDHPARSSATLVPDGTRHRLYTTHPDVRVRFSIMPMSH